MKRIAIAQNTLEILEAGYYISQGGDCVDITRELVSCLDGTTYYDPDVLSNIKLEVLSCWLISSPVQHPMLA